MITKRHVTHQPLLDFLLPSNASDPITTATLARQLTVSTFDFRIGLTDFTAACTPQSTDNTDAVLASARALADPQIAVLDMFDTSFQFEREVRA